MEFIVPDKDKKNRPLPGGRAPIVARKPGNAGGAKGCREMDALCPNNGKEITNR